MNKVKYKTWVMEMRIYVLLQNSLLSILLITLLGFTPEVLQALQGQTTAQDHRMTLTDLQEKFYKAEIEKEIRVEFEEETLEEALAHIARETGLKLTYRGDIIGDKVISLHEKQISVSEALNIILDSTGLEYQISMDGYLLINKNEKC